MMEVLGLSIIFIGDALPQQLPILFVIRWFEVYKSAAPLGQVLSGKTCLKSTICWVGEFNSTVLGYTYSLVISPSPITFYLIRIRWGRDWDRCDSIYLESNLHLYLTQFLYCLILADAV